MPRASTGPPAACSLKLVAAAFREFDLVVADGFTDFTRTEFDLLSLIAQRTKQLLISLPADRPREGEAPRIDLFRQNNGHAGGTQTSVSTTRGPHASSRDLKLPRH